MATMKALYISSIETFSGKTAFCLGIARRMQADGSRVGYLKPLSMQPHQVDGRILDEDAEFVQQVLDLKEPPEVLAPVVLTRALLESHLKGELQRDFVSEVLAAFRTVSSGKDIVLLEGGASLRDGYAVGLSTPTMVRLLGAQALVIVRWRGELHLIDDALAAQFRLGEAMLGVAINAVPEAFRQRYRPPLPGEPGDARLRRPAPGGQTGGDQRGGTGRCAGGAVPGPSGETR
ncbi:MAG: hypothetical protein C4309_11570 [Chloroflexota bacterium]